MKTNRMAYSKNLSKNKKLVKSLKMHLIYGKILKSLKIKGLKTVNTKGKK